MFGHVTVTVMQQRIVGSLNKAKNSGGEVSGVVFLILVGKYTYIIYNIAKYQLSAITSILISDIDIGTNFHQ